MSIEKGELITEKLKAKFDEVATLIYHVREVMVKLANTQPSVVQSWDKIDVNLYLAKDKRLFLAVLSVKSVDEIVKSVENLSNYALSVKESEFYAPLPETVGCKPIDNIFDEEIARYMDDPSPLVELAVETSLSEGAERIAGTIDLKVLDKTLITSKGFKGIERGSEAMIYLRTFKNGFSGHWAHGCRHIDLKSVEETARRAVNYATACKKEVRVETGKYDVVMSPLVVGNLFNEVASMASAFSVLTGFSIFMKHKIGDRVASEKLTVEDAPRAAELAESSAFDDEGLETFNKPIINSGELSTLLHNTKTAKKMGSISTANAGWIAPKTWNILIKPGDSRENEMLEEVKRGILITNNWYTRLQNYVEGQFSTVSRDAALLIENGGIKGCVGRVRITDKFSTILRNIDLIGEKQHLVKWWEVPTPTKAPFILVRKVNLSKPT